MKQGRSNIYIYHRLQQTFLKGGQLKGREFSTAESASNPWGDHGHVFLRNLIAVGKGA